MPTHRKVTKIKYSSLAQSVERMTVNHDVAGSSPARGATESLENLVFSRLFLIFRWFCLPGPTIFLEVKIRRFLLHSLLVVVWIYVVLINCGRCIHHIANDPTNHRALGFEANLK